MGARQRKKEQRPSKAQAPKRTTRPRKLKINPIHNDKKPNDKKPNHGYQASGSQNHPMPNNRPSQPPHQTRQYLTGGGDRNRTDDLLLAKQALSQLSYTPGSEASNQKPEQKTAVRPLPSVPRPAPVEGLASDWWAGEDLNLRPHAYQARALTN